jgi:hypothetical protein
LSTRKHRHRQLALAMIAARLIDPSSKLATARSLNRETLSHSIGEELGVERADVDDLYEALDWLARGQARIEKKLAKRHLKEGQLILWDVSPVPFESHTCPLAAYGRPRGGKSVRQLTFGLLTTAEGLPVAVEVFPGHTGDPTTVATALDRLQGRFGLKRVVVVGDRGMLTQARIEEELKPRGVDWITALRAPTIRKLAHEGPLQLSLFDRQDLAEITSPDFPGERLIACFHPLLAQDRARKREDRVRAHVFVCMLAFYVWKHMEKALAPILFTDHDKPGAEARRASIVAPARRSEAAVKKVRRKQTEEGHTEITFEQYAEPTQLQARAFQLLDVSYRL